MEQSSSSIADFWTSFKPVVPFTPSPDSYNPKPEAPAEFFDYLDIEAFYDSVANGDGPICYVKPNGPFSWGLQAERPSYSYVQTDDDPSDQNNNNKQYCELTSYQDSEDIPHLDHCSLVAQEIIVHTTDEALYTVEQQSVQNWPQDPPAISENNMDEPINIATIKQEFPEPIKLEPEEIASSKQSSPSKLPLKKRNIKFRVHSPTGKHACPSCDRTFNLPSHLRQHFNAHHTGPMDQRCHICGKRFRLPEDLEKHQLRHKEQNKPIVCDHCPKKFNYKFDMIRHVKAVHTEAPYKCQYCKKGVVRYDHLMLHESKHRRMDNKAAAKAIAKKSKRKKAGNEVNVVVPKRKVKLEPESDVDESSEINAQS